MVRRKEYFKLLVDASNTLYVIGNIATADDDNYFNCSTKLYIDPTDEEESLSTGVLTVVVTMDEKLVAVHKPGKEDRKHTCGGFPVENNPQGDHEHSWQKGHILRME